MQLHLLLLESSIGERNMDNLKVVRAKSSILSWAILVGKAR